MTRSPSDLPTVLFDGSRLGLDDIAALSERRARAVLSRDPAFIARIARGADFLDRLLKEDGVVYGVTTGYGDSCTVTIPPDLVAELPHHLYTYHGCGAGRFLTAEETRAVLAVRLASLAQGMSGVSVALLSPDMPCASDARRTASTARVSSGVRKRPAPQPWYV